MTSFMSKLLFIGAVIAIILRWLFSLIFCGWLGCGLLVGWIGYNLIWTVKEKLTDKGFE